MRTRPVTSAILLAACAAGTVGAGGCYKHVVGARGFGADESMKVHEPNAPDQPMTTRTRRLPSGRSGSRSSP